MSEIFSMENILTPEQMEIREGVQKICEKYDDAYWLARDTDGKFPHDFGQELADAGYFGITQRERFPLLVLVGLMPRSRPSRIDL